MKKEIALSLKNYTEMQSSWRIRAIQRGQTYLSLTPYLFLFVCLIPYLILHIRCAELFSNPTLFQ